MRYRLIALILGPFILWSVYFVTLYGVQAVGCRANWDTVSLVGIPMLRLILAIILAASAMVSLAILAINRRIDWDQLGIARIGRYCAVAGLFSTLIIFPGVFWLELC